LAQRVPREVTASTPPMPGRRFTRDG
jgi:hypothetical protein